MLSVGWEEQQHKEKLSSKTDANQSSGRIDDIFFAGVLFLTSTSLLVAELFSIQLLRNQCSPRCILKFTQISKNIITRRALAL